MKRDENKKYHMRISYFIQNNNYCVFSKLNHDFNRLVIYAFYFKKQVLCFVNQSDWRCIKLHSIFNNPSVGHNSFVYWFLEYHLERGSIKLFDVPIRCVTKSNWFEFEGKMVIFQTIIATRCSFHILYQVSVEHVIILHLMIPFI